MFQKEKTLQCLQLTVVMLQKKYYSVTLFKKFKMEERRKGKFICKFLTNSLHVEYYFCVDHCLLFKTLSFLKLLNDTAVFLSYII